MRLKEVREEHDLTQVQIAAFLHIRQNTYSQYENGQRQIPIDLIIKLAKYYKTSVDYLLDLTNELQPYPYK